MRVSSTSILLGALAVKEAVATWQINASPYSNPDNTINVCSEQQKGGFDWGSLTVGTSFTSYGGFNFSGFSCSNNFGKRDALEKRNFQDKCITGSISKGFSSGIGFGCSSHGFSIDEFQITVSIDTELEILYEMQDSSICKQTTSCSKSGTTVKNTQCGGAISVGFQIPDIVGSISGCDIGIHSVGFNCHTTTTPSHPGYTPPSYSFSPNIFTTVRTETRKTESSSSSSSSLAAYSTSSSASSSLAPYSTPTSSSSSSSSSTLAAFSTPSSSSSSSSASSSSPSSSPARYTPPAYTPPSYSTPGASSSTTKYSNSTSSSSLAVYSTFSSSSSSSTPESSSSSSSSLVGYNTITTKVSSSTSSSTLNQATGTSSSSSSSSPSSSSSDSSFIPSYTVSSSSSSSSASSSACSLPTSSPPDVLPRCMNSFLLPSCKDNTDFSCYCKDDTFVKEVYDCITSWESDTTLITEALSFFVGLCADFVVGNPGIVTHCPSTVTLGPSSIIPSSCTSTPPAGYSITESIITPSSFVSIPYGASVITETVVGPTGTAVVTISVGGTGSGIVSYGSPTGAPAGYSVITESVAPGSTPPSFITTITVSVTQTVACTESTGSNSGSTIPGSSTISTYQTTVTVPQVAFTTGTVTVSGVASSTVNVIPGTPAAVSATATASVGTVNVPYGTATASFATFTGAAVKINTGSFSGAAFAAALAVLAF